VPRENVSESLTMILESCMAQIKQEDLSHKKWPNDLENEPKQASQSSLHKHGHSTVCVDFDGVIASYDGYRGRGVIGKEIPEGLELLHQLNRMGYYIVVLTARQELEIVGKWLVDHGVGFAKPTNTKPPAVAYFDDRALHVDWSKETVANLLTQLKDLDKRHVRVLRPGV
jgi:hypothetical protein